MTIHKRSRRVSARSKYAAATKLYAEMFFHLDVPLAVWCLGDSHDAATLRLVASNRAAKQATGVDLENCKGTEEIFPGFLLAEIPDALRDVILSGEARVLGEVAYGDGQELSAAYRVTAFRLPSNCAGVIWESILERKQAEEAINKQAQLLDLAHDAIIVRDLDSSITFWNRGAEKTYGWTSAQVLGKVTHSLLQTEFPEPFESVQNKLMSDGWWEGELVHTRRDRSRIVVMSRQALQRGAEGHPTAILEINRDITARKEVESELLARVRVAALGAEIGVALNESASAGAALRKCCETLGQFLGAAFTRIWTLNPASRILELQASAGMYTHLDGVYSRLPVGSLKIGTIAETRKPFLTNTVDREPGLGEPEWARREGVVAFAGYPLIVDERAVGVVAAFSQQPFAEAALRGFEAVANTIAQFIERKGSEDALRQRTRDLQVSADEMRSISARLLDVQAEERRRLARELHDGSGQTLAAAGLQLALFKRRAGKLPAELRGPLAEASDLIVQASDELRTLAHLLHPPQLEAGGLAVLPWYVDGFAKRSGIKAELEMPDLKRLSDEVETTIFRVIQECLTNIHRHSGASGAKIRLQATPDRVTLLISDNGHGAPPGLLEGASGEPGRLGVGILGMRERAQQLGGRLEIQSGPSGTAVTLDLPISPTEGSS